MPLIDPDVIDRIKTAATDELAVQLARTDLTPSDSMNIAASVLAAIDNAIVDPLDPTEFPVGSRVEAIHDPGTTGTVVRRVETGGELHTVLVVFDDHPGEHAVSPRALKVVAL